MCGSRAKLDPPGADSRLGLFVCLSLPGPWDALTRPRGKRWPRRGEFICLASEGPCCCPTAGCRGVPLSAAVGGEGERLCPEQAAPEETLLLVLGSLQRPGCPLSAGWRCAEPWAQELSGGEVFS